MKKIVVPEGMLKAGLKAAAKCSYGGIVNVGVILEDALRWLTEHPIVPTFDQGLEILGQIKPYNMWTELYMQVIEIWQRRMFDAPELEVPEEIRELLNLAGSHGGPTRDEFHRCVLEAYRRGQKSKS